jgi:hypothetical protein
MPGSEKMMRKLSQLVLGGAIGVAATLMATQSAVWLEGAHAAPKDGYRQLSLFGLVFERVRTEYVDKGKARPVRDQRYALRAGSAFGLYGCDRLSQHAGGHSR